MFKNFARFRVLVCGGDGSVSWVLSTIDAFGLHDRVSSWLSQLTIAGKSGGCGAIYSKKSQVCTYPIYKHIFYKLNS